jgi:hypothetical protein
MIPNLDLDRFTATAKLDFVRFWFDLHGSALELPVGRCRTVRAENDALWVVTIHDPQPGELARLVEEGEDPALHGLEVSIDFRPKVAMPAAEHEAVLKELFSALAARFRPEDHLPTGVGFKAGFRSPRPEPFHRRHPGADMTLVYGHRSTGANMKLYLKRQDQGRALPVEQWCVRLEASLAGHGLYLVGIGRMSSLFGYRYRATFARWFTVIDHVQVRRNARWSRKRVAELADCLERGWRRAGVNALGPKTTVVDALPGTRGAITYREDETIPPEHYSLHPHRRAHELISNALRQLERRMVQRFSGGAAPASEAKSLMTEGISTS